VDCQAQKITFDEMRESDVRSLLSIAVIIVADTAARSLHPIRSC